MEQSLDEETRAALEKELREVEDKIDAAYWKFSRQARAKPPVLVVPEAYERRNEIRALLGKGDRKRP
jgi:hypothetical protein